MTLAEKAKLPEQVVQRMSHAIRVEAAARNQDEYDVRGRIERVKKRAHKQASIRIRRCLGRLNESSMFRYFRVDDCAEPAEGKVSARRHVTEVETYLSGLNQRLRKQVIAGHSYLKHQLRHLWLLSENLLSRLSYRPAKIHPGWSLIL